MKKYKNYFESPIGILEVVTDDKNVLEINFVETKDISEENKVFYKLKKELEEYFSGIRKVFTIQYLLEGTEFQKKVWIELSKIPYGEVRSYKEIAEKIGNPKSGRAVGNANNKNKLPILIPCHRVIGSNGNLTGYAAGVLKKEYLLKLEEENV